MILDFDVHHGNGTQDLFYADPSVLFMDMHEHDVWPGSGQPGETGEGAGVGATINIPMAGERKFGMCLNVFSLGGGEAGIKASNFSPNWFNTSTFWLFAVLWTVLPRGTGTGWRFFQIGCGRSSCMNMIQLDSVSCAVMPSAILCFFLLLMSTGFPPTA